MRDPDRLRQRRLASTASRALDAISRAWPHTVLPPVAPGALQRRDQCRGGIRQSRRSRCIDVFSHTDRPWARCHAGAPPIRGGAGKLGMDSAHRVRNIL